MSSLGISVSVKLSGEQGTGGDHNGMLRKASQSACPYGKRQQNKILFTFLYGQKESKMSSVMLCFPTIVPTNRLNPHNPNWYPVKLLNSKKPSNPCSTRDWRTFIGMNGHDTKASMAFW